MYGSARSVSKQEAVGANGGGSGASGSPGRSPRLPRSPRLGHRRNGSGGGGGGGLTGLTGSCKTLSMENIQSLNAAYATSGPMYFTDHGDAPAPGLGAGAGSGLNPAPPKGTMTLGRGVARLPFGARGALMGSNPNISAGGLGGGGLPSDAIAFGGETQGHASQGHASQGHASQGHASQGHASQGATVPHSMRQVREGAMSDLQTQLREVLRENELLRRELEAKESKLSSSMNSIKTFWSPELKKERALRKDEATKMSVWREQYGVVQSESQPPQLTSCPPVRSHLGRMEGETANR
ncbi:unnamed protein product [Boreogadus saida]